MQLIFPPKKVASQTNSKLRTENSENMLNFLSYHDPRFLLNLPNAFSMFSSIPRGSRLELLGKWKKIYAVYNACEHACS